MLLSGIVRAGEFYAGAGVGVARQKDVFARVELDAREITGKVALGFRIVEFFAVEGTYTIAGEFVVSDGEGTLTEQTSTAALWAAGFAPLTERLFFHARVGAAHARTDVTLARPDAGLSEQRDTTVFAWGLGFGVAVAPRWDLRLDVELYDTGGTTRLDVYTIGALYRFGRRSGI